MGRADLHNHTTYSDGMGTVPAVLEAARRAGLDIIAITDHDTMAGARRARDLAPRYGIRVIPGVEISTSEGHLLAYWIEREVPAGKPLIDTLLRVREQGGLCVAAHPTAQFLSCLGLPTIRKAMAHAEAGPVLAGVEVYNGGLPRLIRNRSALAIGRTTGLSQVANSDSHMVWTIGIFATGFPGASPQALRYALENRLTQPIVGKRPAGYVTSWMAQRIVRFTGFAYWSAHPGAEIVLRRLATVQ
jgi:predicted metal-dependent phosphoesterase TrpH